MSKFNVDDKVKYIGPDHAEHSDFYPLYGTIGEIKEVCDDHCWVQWPKGSTSDDDYWSCDEINLEAIKTNKNKMIQNINDMTNEEIWEMLKPKMEKNALTTKNLHAGLFGPIYTYNEKDVHNAIALAYRSGYLRAMKGRPFKIGEKKKKCRHWEPVDPENLPKEGTKVRYARHIDDAKSTPFSKWNGIQIGEETVVLYDLTAFGVKNIHNKPTGMNWLSSYKHPDRFDMWVEDDE